MGTGAGTGLGIAVTTPAEDDALDKGLKTTEVGAQRGSTPHRSTYGKVLDGGSGAQALWEHHDEVV